MAGVLIFKMRNAPRTVILPMDHLVMELRKMMQTPIFMIQPKHAVEDLTGLILVLVCQFQRRIQQD